MINIQKTEVNVISLIYIYIYNKIGKDLRYPVIEMKHQNYSTLILKHVKELAEVNESHPVHLLTIMLGMRDAVLKHIHLQLNIRKLVTSKK